MRKLVASVTQVLRDGIHRLGTVEDGEVRSAGELPRPDRVEIEMQSRRSDPCMMYRYMKSNECCGDTWHEDLDGALEQAAYEYGLTEKDFRDG